MMEEKYSAVLISAGMARRMYPHTIDFPKCLLEIKGSLTILDYQIKALISAGISNVYIILGFKAKLITDYIASKKYLINIIPIYNPFYEVSNNLASLWLGLKDINEPVITINGDNIFSTEIIKNISKSEGDIVLARSTKSGYDEDDMKIILNNNNKLKKISKKISIPEAQGESIGVIKYNKEGLRVFKQRIDSLIYENHNNINNFYLSVIQSLIDNNYEINTFEVDKDSWREFDYAEDLSNVRHELQKGLLTGDIFSSYE